MRAHACTHASARRIRTERKTRPSGSRWHRQGWHRQHRCTNARAPCGTNTRLNGIGREKGEVPAAQTTRRQRGNRIGSASERARTRSSTCGVMTTRDAVKRVMYSVVSRCITSLSWWSIINTPATANQSLVDQTTIEAEVDEAFGSMERGGVYQLLKVGFARDLLLVVVQIVLRRAQGVQRPQKK